MRLFTAIPLLCFFIAASAQENERDSEQEIRILSAYHGLDPLPPLATTRLCGLPPTRGQDGMPVTFSVQLNSASVSATAFAVKTSSGETVTPLCATLRPAIETLEKRTVLLIGSFSVDKSLPRSVEIVEQLEDVDGNSLVGLKIEKVTPLASGPSLVLAERFAPDTLGLDGEGPIDIDGNSVHPLFLAEDDPDNHVIACVAETSPAVLVSVAAGLFYDPGDDANPETRIDVISRMNE